MNLGEAKGNIRSDAEAMRAGGEFNRRFREEGMSESARERLEKMSPERKAQQEELALKFAQALSNAQRARGMPVPSSSRREGDEMDTFDTVSKIIFKALAHGLVFYGGYKAVGNKKRYALIFALAFASLGGYVEGHSRGRRSA